MNKFLVYLKLELKRILKLFPMICMVTFVVLAAAGFFFINQDEAQKNTEAPASISGLKNMQIGIVSDEGDLPFLDMGLYMVQHTDKLKYICSFINVSEEKGQEMLENEQLDMLAIFPSDYVESVYYGVNEPIVVRFGSAQSGVSSLMFRQLAEAVSDYMMEAKAGTYAMQDMYLRWGLAYGSDADRLAEKYIMRILARNGALSEEKVDATLGMSSTVYYGCVALVLIMMFWGLNCGSVLGKNQKIMTVLLARHKLSEVKQYIAKYIAVLILFLMNFIVIALSAAVIMKIMNIDIVPIYAYFQVLPVLMAAAAMVLCVYEISNDGIGGMLFFFFATVILSFLSGFFYPLSYFPIWLQKIAEFLPTKIMFDYISKCITEDFLTESLIKVSMCTIIFAAVTIMSSGLKIRFSIRTGKRRGE